MYIKVRAITGLKEDKIEKINENTFKIFVREKAERGEANKKICELLDNYFNKPVGGVRIVNGHQHPMKLVKIGKD
jgi:uncharacterized protein YggU (UPF0235/DUF167 family)